MALVAAAPLPIQDLGSSRGSTTGVKSLLGYGCQLLRQDWVLRSSNTPWGLVCINCSS